jgi:hypothetical protein
MDGWMDGWMMIDDSIRCSMFFIILAAPPRVWRSAARAALAGYKFKLNSVTRAYRYQVFVSTKPRVTS